jgi:hypothetical protein
VVVTNSCACCSGAAVDGNRKGSAPPDQPPEKFRHKSLPVIAKLAALRCGCRVSRARKERDSKKPLGKSVPMVSLRGRG